MANKNSSYDYLIVGQGIAGSVLAFAMLRKGLKVYVIDQPQEHSTSKVAAGLFNPITGHKMSKTWLAEKIFPALQQFYSWLEVETGASFYYPRLMYVPFDSVEKQNDWLAKSALEGYDAFVNGFVPKRYEKELHGAYGGMEVQQTGFVDTRAMLAACRNYLLQKGLLLEGFVNPMDLSFADGGIEWEGIKAKKAIFCEGIRNRINPFFYWLDYRPAKGEILTVAMPQAPFQEIINRGCWIIQQANGSFRVGSNFERSIEASPSEKGKAQVVEKLTTLTPLAYTIIDHQAGIRPATYDRRPFIGLHPEEPALAVFGGLGSKGISLAPYFASHFVEVLEGQEVLMPEVRLERKWKK